MRLVARVALVFAALLILFGLDQTEWLGLNHQSPYRRIVRFWLPLLALCAYGMMWLFWWLYRVLSLEAEPPFEDLLSPNLEYREDDALSVRQERPASVRRLTDVSFPNRVKMRKTYNLRIQLMPVEEVLPGGRVRERALPHPHDARVNLLVSPPPGPGVSAPPITVGISIAAENFEIEGTARAELIVPLEGKSTAVQFGLTGLEEGPGRVMIDFSQDGRPVASVDLYPHVVAELETEAQFGVSAPAPGLLDLKLAAAAGPEPPDLMLKVFEHRLTGHPGRLQFVLSSTHPALADLPVLDGDLGTLDLRAEIAAWVGAQLQTLGALAGQANVTAAEAEQALAHVGCNLFRQLLPPALQDLYWTIRGRGVRSLMVLSDEPHIPWELIKPFRVDAATGAVVEEDRFWGDSFALTRWLRGRPPAHRLSVRRAVTVIAGSTCQGSEREAVPGSTASSSLTDREPLRDMVVPEAADEASRGPTVDFPASNPESPPAETTPDCASDYSATLCALDPLDEERAVVRLLESYGASTERLPARLNSLRRVFGSGEFELLHIASHGTFGGTSTADNSAILLDDGSFSVAELSPLMAASFRRTAPLIFFNTCHSARLGFSPTGLGAWGARLLELGCGGFVGALWPVTDRGATAFASVFYELICQGRRIGEAMQLARRHVHQRFPGDPTWLAYSCFADPMARVNPPSP